MQPTATPRRLYNVREVAHMLGMSERKVWGLCDDGTIQSVKAGGHRRIPAESVDAYIEQLKASSAAHATGQLAPAGEESAP